MSSTPEKKNYPNQSTEINRNCYCSRMIILILFLQFPCRNKIQSSRIHFPEKYDEKKLHAENRNKVL